MTGPQQSQSTKKKKKMHSQSRDHLRKTFVVNAVVIVLISFHILFHFLSVHTHNFK